MKSFSADEQLFRQILSEDSRKLGRLPSQNGGIGRFIHPEKVGSFKTTHSEFPTASALAALSSASEAKHIQRRVRFLSDEGLSSLPLKPRAVEIHEECLDESGLSTSNFNQPHFPASISFGKDVTDQHEERTMQSLYSQEFIFDFRKEVHAEEEDSIHLLSRRKTKLEMQVSIPKTRESLLSPSVGGIGRFTPTNSDSKDPKSPWFEPAPSLFGPPSPFEKTSPSPKPKERRKVRFSESENVPHMDDDPRSASVSPSPLRQSPLRNMLAGSTRVANDASEEGYFSDSGSFPHSANLPEPACGCGGPSRQKKGSKSSRLPEFGHWEGSAEGIAEKFERLALERQKQKKLRQAKPSKSARWLAGASRRVFGAFEEMGRSVRMKSRARTFRAGKSGRGEVTSTVSSRSSVYVGSPLRWDSDDEEEPEWLKEERGGELALIRRLFPKPALPQRVELRLHREERRSL